MVGKRMPTQPIFLYNVTENSPTSLAHNSVLIGPNNFRSVTETCCMVLQAISKFGANWCMIMFWWRHMQTTIKIASEKFIIHT